LSKKMFPLSILLLALFLVSLSPIAMASHHNTEMKPDIVQTAVSAGTFQTLAAALTAADLIDVLKGPGPFTVFAPTDEAFAKLPPGTVDTLLRPENKDQLISILKYHVVPGKFMAADVMVSKSFLTCNMHKVQINVMDGKVMVKNALVTGTDIMASNGVIHVIDSVLLPE